MQFSVVGPVNDGVSPRNCLINTDHIVSCAICHSSIVQPVSQIKADVDAGIRPESRNNAAMATNGGSLQSEPQLGCHQGHRKRVSENRLYFSKPVGLFHHNMGKVLLIIQTEAFLCCHQVPGTNVIKYRVSLSCSDSNVKEDIPLAV